jgi:hypothetical protein
MANNAITTTPTNSLHGSPVRRDREDDSYQQPDSDKENTLLTMPVNVPASNPPNIFIDAINNAARRKKAAKKKKVESSGESDNDDGPHRFGYKRPPLPNPKDAAEEDFKEETESILEQQRQYTLHLANLRVKYLDDSSEFLRNETPRLAELIANEDFGGLIEDPGHLSEIQDRARKYIEQVTIKFRSARGQQSQRNDAQQQQEALEKAMSVIGKEMLQLYAAVGNLLTMATENGDEMARITYMTKAAPRWACNYDMLMDRAEQWIYLNYVIKMFDTNIKLFKDQQQKQQIKHEMDALGIAESDLDASSSSSEDDSGEDEEGSDGDSSSDESVDGATTGDDEQ